ncbi:MAG: hypothetical protein HC845_16055, partial [Akkermansiaceae bacterium]|nr:hypothetical protein [Akkermansiaceae bacterium]
MKSKPTLFFRNTISRSALGSGLFALALSSFSQAVPVTLWQIGEDKDPYTRNYDSPTADLGDTNYAIDAAPGKVTRLPGDPLYNSTNNPTADDHFYLAGTYPIGFNSLTSQLVVPNAEPAKSYEAYLRNSDPANSIHFILNATQVTSQSRLRLSFELVNGGSYSAPTNGDDFGKHNIEIRFNNTLILQRNGVDRDSRFNIDIPAA